MCKDADRDWHRLSLAPDIPPCPWSQDKGTGRSPHPEGLRNTHASALLGAGVPQEPAHDGGNLLPCAAKYGRGGQNGRNNRREFRWNDSGGYGWLQKRCSKAVTLLLSNTGLVGLPGFEPGTSCTPSKRASQAAPQPDMNDLQQINRCLHACLPFLGSIIHRTICEAATLPEGGHSTYSSMVQMQPSGFRPLFSANTKGRANIPQSSRVHGKESLGELVHVLFDNVAYLKNFITPNRANGGHTPRRREKNV